MLEGLVADRAAIDRDDELCAFRSKSRNRLDIRAVALRDPVGDVDDGLAATGDEVFAKQSRAAGAVDVVVAEDRDALALLDRALQPLGRRRHVAHDEGIGHELPERRIEIALDRLRLDPPPRQHTRDQFVLAADLGDGESAQFAPGVEARPPRPPQRRALDIEKIA